VATFSISQARQVEQKLPGMPEGAWLASVGVWPKCPHVILVLTPNMYHNLAMHPHSPHGSMLLLETDNRVFPAFFFFF
jgi:hypothetical protein